MSRHVYRGKGENAGLRATTPPAPSEPAQGEEQPLQLLQDFRASEHTIRDMHKWSEFRVSQKLPLLLPPCHAKESRTAKRKMMQCSSKQPCKFSGCGFQHKASLPEIRMKLYTGSLPPQGTHLELLTIEVFSLPALPVVKIRIPQNKIAGVEQLLLCFFPSTAAGRQTCGIKYQQETYLILINLYWLLLNNPRD